MDLFILVHPRHCGCKPLLSCGGWLSLVSPSYQQTIVGNERCEGSWNETIRQKEKKVSFRLEWGQKSIETARVGLEHGQTVLFSFFLSLLLISAPRLLSEKIFLSFWSLVFIVLFLLFSCAPNRFTTPRVPHCLRVTLSVKSTTAKLFAPNPETLPNRTTNEAKRNHTPHRKQQGVCSLVRCRRGKKKNK